MCSQFTSPLGDQYLAHRRAWQYRGGLAGDLRFPIVYPGSRESPHAPGFEQCLHDFVLYSPLLAQLGQTQLQGLIEFILINILVSQPA